MDPVTLEITMQSAPQGNTRERLDHAASITRAAQTCADPGNVEKGVEIALDVEQLIYEVNTFLNAASLINRINTT